MQSTETKSLIARYLDDMKGPKGPAYEKGWEQFLRDYGPRLEAWAKDKNRDTAEVEEIIGRVLSKLVTKIPEFQYDAGRSFSGWLRTMVRNEAHDYWKSGVRKFVGEGGSDALDRFVQMPERPIGEGTTWSQIRAAMKETPAKPGETEEQPKIPTWDIANQIVEEMIEALDDLFAQEGDRISIAAEVAQSVERRVKPENWRAFVAIKSGRMDIAGASAHFGRKPTEITQALHRISKMIKQEWDKRDIRFPES